MDESADKPKGNEKPVSLAPLDFEEALDGLLKVKPDGPPEVVDDLVLTRDQVAAIIERESLSRYGFTAQDLIKRYRQGTIDPCGGAADLIALARMLPPSDSLGLGG